MYQTSYVTIKVHKRTQVLLPHQRTGCGRPAAGHNPNGGCRTRPVAEDPLRGRRLSRPDRTARWCDALSAFAHKLMADVSTDRDPGACGQGCGAVTDATSRGGVCAERQPVTGRVRSVRTAAADPSQIAHRQGQVMSFTHARPAAGLVLLAALAAGCGTAVTAHHAAPKPAAPAHSHAAASTPAASAPAAAMAHHRHRHHSRPMHVAVSTPPAPPAPPTTAPPPPPPNPIPQGNGGDQDADNNGGPSDGDGNI
jgi:hypothetical protein